ncbi:MAG: polysaccharide biosynthesis/export family protein [Pseudomonadota bacterium]
MKVPFYLMFIVGLLFSGCAIPTYKMFDGNITTVQTVSDSNYTEEAEFEWKIAKGDRLEIIVVSQSSGDGQQELNQILNTGGRMQAALTRDGTEGYLVPKAGTVRLPLVGAVSIVGLTENQAAEKLLTAYQHYLKNPFVTVKILNQKLFVLGEVRKPGVVQVTNGTMSLFEALAYSGDLTDDAERSNVRVIRGGLRTPSMREIDLANISSMQLTSLILKPNDIVYIQPRSMKAYNVAFKEQMPFFELLHAMLFPFVDYTQIKNGKAIDVFFK